MEALFTAAGCPNSKIKKNVTDMAKTYKNWAFCSPEVSPKFPQKRCYMEQSQNASFARGRSYIVTSGYIPRLTSLQHDCRPDALSAPRLRHYNPTAGLTRCQRCACALAPVERLPGGFPKSYRPHLARWRPSRGYPGGSPKVTAPT